jgi:hypothetical protein
MAEWRVTSQTALVPQIVLRQGSIHSCETQALSNGQSLLSWQSSTKQQKVRTSYSVLPIKHLHWKHSVCGFPAHPLGQRHTGLCEVV